MTRDSAEETAGGSAEETLLYTTEDREDSVDELRDSKLETEVRNWTEKVKGGVTTEETLEYLPEEIGGDATEDSAEETL